MEVIATGIDLELAAVAIKIIVEVAAIIETIVEVVAGIVAQAGIVEVDVKGFVISATHLESIEESIDAILVDSGLGLASSRLTAGLQTIC